MGKQVRSITLKTILYLFVFCLGFILSELRFADKNFHPFVEVFVYDTDKKIEDLFMTFERTFSEKMGLPPESPEVKEYMDQMRAYGRPLVAVGPFIIFIDNDGVLFSVHEIQLFEQEQELSMLPLVQLTFSEQSKRLDFASSVEKGSRLPRFFASFTYSKDGIYERGTSSIFKDDFPARMYIDSQGTGFFCTMVTIENDAFNTYHLNNLTWELVSEEQYPEWLKNFIEGPLNYTLSF